MCICMYIYIIANIINSIYTGLYWCSCQVPWFGHSYRVIEATLPWTLDTPLNHFSDVFCNCLEASFNALMIKMLFPFPNEMPFIEEPSEAILPDGACPAKKALPSAVDHC